MNVKRPCGVKLAEGDVEPRFVRPKQVFGIIELERFETKLKVQLRVDLSEPARKSHKFSD
ncbi:MAG: hypothetical protein QXP27_09545 [Candidatus Methanomethyliaceae archaeon]